MKMARLARAAVGGLSIAAAVAGCPEAGGSGDAGADAGAKNWDSGSDAALDAARDATSDAGCSGGATEACYHAPDQASGQGGTCQELGNIPQASVSTLAQMCTSQGGTSSAHCPATAQLIGCCTTTNTQSCSSSTVCSYLYGATSSDAAAGQMQCLQGNGPGVVATWSTTPP